MNFFHPSSLPACLALALLASTATTEACMNWGGFPSGGSSYEEQQITEQLEGNLTKVIMGEFPLHSEAFWYHMMLRHEAVLEQDPDAVESLNDRAVALTKLEHYEEAEQAFAAIENRFPERYKTASNLGVLYKKTGRYQEAAEQIARSLEIKPAGHLGLGDYYQRMLEWRAKTAADPEAVYRSNFLGIPRTASPAEIAADPRVNRKHLITLIKADRHFADAYAVLGSVLQTEGAHQRANAVRAFQRAKELEPDARLRELYDVQLALAHKHGHHDFGAERDAVQRWHVEYTISEHELLRQTGRAGAAPTINAVYAHLAGRQAETPRYQETKTVRIEKPHQNPLKSLTMFTGIVLLGLFVIRRGVKLIK